METKSIKPIYNKGLVHYSGNPNDKFDPELIDNITIKGLFSDDFEKCEYWGYDGEEGKDFNYFGMLGRHLHFEIYEDRTRLYSGEGIDGCVKEGHRADLFFVDRAEEIDHIKLLRRRTEYLEKVFITSPSTMLDFLHLIQDYYAYIEQQFLCIKHFHRKDYIFYLIRKQVKVPTNKVDVDTSSDYPIDDLPF